MKDNNRETPLVLVADDEPSMLTLVARHVRSLGFEVLEASDGDLAWKKAMESLPDLVVLDVMMPGMSGWEVCKKIRETPALAHTGVLMLTGIGETLNEMTSPLYGADAYIDKPFEFQDLDEKIRDVLQERQEQTNVMSKSESATDDLDEISHEIPTDGEEPTLTYTPGQGASTTAASGGPESDPMPRFELSEDDDEDEEFYNAVTLRPPNASNDHPVDVPLSPKAPQLDDIPASETIEKKTAKKTAAKKSTKKAAAKKTAAKKSTKKAAAKKTAAKKSTKKAAAKKTAAKKSTKKAAAKKTTAKKSTKKSH